jgi:hypothetical protein
MMVARSSVEAALSDLFARNSVPLPDSMRDRLNRAENYGWIDRNTSRNAWTVWQRGNKVVHDEPDAISDVWGTVQAAIRAVNGLVE